MKKIIKELKNRCKLLDIEMPLNMICPTSMNYKERFVCYADCGFSSLRDKNKKIRIKLNKKIQTTLDGTEIDDLVIYDIR